MSRTAPAAGAVTATSGAVLLTLASGQFLMALDSSVMNVSIATVADDLGTTVTDRDHSVPCPPYRTTRPPRWAGCSSRAASRRVNQAPSPDRPDLNAGPGTSSAPLPRP
jgi:hypothetical protein